MVSDLSPRTKQAFQVAGLIATAMVVGIHYKTDIPDLPFIEHETANELAQEWLFGTVARVAVPFFAFAAGLFYFRSFDGRWSSYIEKLRGRGRTVLIPYFLIASTATTFWLAVQSLRGVPVEMTVPQFVSMWIFSPPVEQLWFLRDLLVIVTITPFIHRIFLSRFSAIPFVLLLLTCWLLNAQPLPLLAGRHLIHIETLCFFTIGATFAYHPEILNRIANWPSKNGYLFTALWLTLVSVRVFLRPDFDIWYVHAYQIEDLVIHQCSVLLGCVALFWWSVRLSRPAMIRWSGASFFVFLVHEYPLRAFVEQIIQKLGDPPAACWFVVPLVVASTFACGIWGMRCFPRATTFLTGGRTPQRALKISRSSFVESA
ncbi:MAG: acyltransferase [Planctomycetota bacterium]